MTRPQHIPGLAVLLDELSRHVRVLLDHQLVAPAENRGRHAVGAWSAAHLLAERALEPRWHYATMALIAGQHAGSLTPGSGLTVEEIHVGLSRWLDAEVTAGRVTDEERAQVRALIGGAR